MSNDKDLSKPVAWMYEWAGCVTCEGPQDWRVEITDEAPPSWAVMEGRCRNLKALFQREYVNLLLIQIASLKSERETMHGVEYVQSLLGRIAELEGDKENMMQCITGGLAGAARDVAVERIRQVEKEGWTPEHDDQHENGEMAFAAASYAFHAAAAMWDLEDFGTAYGSHHAPKNWPWDNSWWKPVSPRRDLVRAGALILAEIDRLDRKEEGDQK